MRMSFNKTAKSTALISFIKWKVFIIYKGYLKQVRPKTDINDEEIKMYLYQNKQLIDNNKKNLPKNPATGGIPAKENKEIPSIQESILFLRQKPL